AEAVELLLGEPALEERTGVDARRRVALDEHLVARLTVVLAAEEVVEAHLVQAGGGRVGRDVTAHAHPRPVGAGHHDRGVPPDIGPDPALHVLVAGEPRLALGRDGIDVVRAAQARHAHLLRPGPLQQPEHHVPGPPATAGPDDIVERLDPLPGLIRVDVGELGRQAVADDGEALASGGHGVFLAFRGAQEGPRAATFVVILAAAALPRDASLLAGNRAAPGREDNPRGPARRPVGSIALDRAQLGTPGRVCGD